MSVLTDLKVIEQKCAEENGDDEQMFKIYIRSIATSLAIIADEQREANRLKKVEIEQMKKRKI